ncbi:hypothetical protein CR105_23135 [Massilia eurypsychrophila]|uniref:Conjugal transfer protein TraM n=1 Tax=Massilia eurypsychrophila TaxID=1485217 RepID=A0A2G8TAB3_9BURK|nr:hypothetical protein [Massilia eurypsychrophila]PIL42628.1 hypothetical protein CR105_23135 [Massilia eurypsychrophila]
MDIQRLQNQVFERTGIRIDAVDPVFTVVALNEAVFEELMRAYEEAQAKSNGELDERIGSLVVLHRNLVAAGKDLTERADQAHLNSALKAAADAKADIMTAARQAVSAEMEKAVALLAKATEEARANGRRGWGVAIVQAAIGGIVAAMIVLAVLQIK